MSNKKMAEEVKIFLWYWFPALLFAGFILFLSTRPDLKSDFPREWDLVLRKIGHVGMYFVMTLLLARIGLREVTDKNVRVAAIFVAGLGALILAFMDENIQAFVPGRSGSMKDAGFDLVGILTATGTLFWRSKKRQEI